MAEPLEPAWGTCQHCGRAVPAPEGICPSCGQHDTVAPAAIPALPVRSRRRVRLFQVVRVALVVVVVLGLAYDMVSAVYSGPPTYPDPLTTTGTYTLGPGNFTVLSGAITGEDYVDGNYTVVNPVGTSIVFAVYNATSYTSWVRHAPATAQWTTTGSSSSAIVFDAPYTDTFFLVFQNPYLPGSGIVQTIYISTAYQSNVLIG